MKIPPGTRVGIAPIPRLLEAWAGPAVAHHPSTAAQAALLAIPAVRPPSAPDDATPDDLAFLDLIPSVYFVWFPPSARRPRVPAFGLPPGFDPLVAATMLVTRCWAAADHYRGLPADTALRLRQIAELNALRERHQAQTAALRRINPK